MAQLDGDPVAMAQAAGIFDTKIGNLEAMFRSVAQQAEAMPWSGPNARKYLQILDAWEIKFKKVIDDLVTMREQLADSGRKYDGMEQENAQTISTLQSVLDGLTV